MGPVADTAVMQITDIFPHASEITPEGNTSDQSPISFLNNNTEEARYEQEIRLEMDRRGNFHGNHGNDICCQRRQSVPEVAEEELERRLLWAKQMLLQNPALCARSCQLPGL